MNRRDFCRSLPAVPLLPALAKGTTPEAVVKQRAVRRFFQRSTLHTIEIKMEPGAWSELRRRYQEDIYFAARVRTEEFDLGAVEVRSRGSASRSPEKPSLRVRRAKGEGKWALGSLRAFVLNNCLEDASYLRDYLAMRAFDHVGLAAPRRAFARVVVNGEPWGLYSLGEVVDERFRKRQLGGGAALFDVKDGQALPVDRAPESAEQLSQWLDDRAHKKGRFGSVAKLLSKLHTAPAGELVASLGQQLDWFSTLRYLAVESVLDVRDGAASERGIEGAYLYRLADDGRFRLLPWGKTRSMGNVEAALAPENSNYLVSRMLAEPVGREIYVQQLRHVAEKLSKDDWFGRQASEAAQLTRAAALADQFRRTTGAGYEQAVQLVIDFCRLRPEIVRQHA
jgi:spore coat protein CotH